MTAKATTSPSPRIIRLPEVVDRIGMSRGSVYRMMTLGRFPKSVKLSERAVGWRESDLDAWLESREHAA